MADTDKLTINGQEYTPEDASSLIELGNKYRETEKNLNTSLDELMPKYTKATQKAARTEQLEQELAERNKQLEEFQTKATKPVIPEDKLKARQAARELGLADEDYLKEKGYMTRTEMDDYYSQKQNQQQLVDNVLKNANKLEKEIDGSDGRVPFVQKAVLAYASAYNLSDLNEAYNEMNEKANARWKEAQIEKERKPGLTTLGPGGVKSPKSTKITDSNFKEAWDELYGGQE